MIKKPSNKSLFDAYQFDKFKTGKLAKGRFGDKTALVLSLSRRSKKVYAGNVIAGTAVGMIENLRVHETFQVVTAVFMWSSRSDVFAAGSLAW